MIFQGILSHLKISILRVQKKRKIESYNIKQSNMTEKIYSSSRAQVYDATSNQIKVLDCKTNYNENPELAQQASTETSKKKLYIIVGLVILIIVIGVVLAVTLTLLLKRNQPGKQPEPKPTPGRMYSCQNFPTECLGVLQSVQNYIFDTCNDTDQILAQLQLGRYFSNIHVVDRWNFRFMYLKIFKSIQCMGYTMPDNFVKAYSDIIQLQLTTEESLINYLNMTYSFSGYPNWLTPQDRVRTTCEFNLTRRLRRRYLQTSCSPFSTKEMIASFNENGCSPILNYLYLKKVYEFMAQNSSANFDVPAKIWGPSFKDQFTTYFLDILTEFETDLRTNNQPIPSRRSLLWCLRVFIDYDTLVQSGPADMPGELIGKLRHFFRLKLIQSLINNGTTYYNITKLIGSMISYVNVGWKVVLLVHADGAINANLIYNALSPRQKQSIGLVYTSPYTSHMSDGLTNYISNPNDQILINLTSIATNYSIPTPMAPNVASKIFDRSIGLGQNHDFRGYLESYRAQLTELLASAKNRLIQPPMNTQVLGVYLAWSTQSDINLHVFEPSGAHVYWNNLQVLGRLQVQESAELYRIGCYFFAPGYYTVGVNYYSGTGPVQINLTIKLNDIEVGVKSMTLSSAVGSPGDTNPTLIWKISLSYDPSRNVYTIGITDLIV